ncbi:unnamed protein product [Pocillopora meandrina]|uniref:Uncharacterized protein n=1 Tax=Pocillopora meandrina TaxID=46732 RepID=A0AAU9XT46_9CNID|nr:unnamed protein product [Pocillopora meandrina]
MGCLLYEAHQTTKIQSTSELNLQKRIQEINPKLALAQIMNPRSDKNNFKVCCDVDSVSRREQTNNEITIDQFPRLPLKVSDSFQGPTDINAEEQTLLQDITVTVDELNKIEQATRGQSNSDEWKKQRKLGITAFNFARTTKRKR